MVEGSPNPLRVFIDIDGTILYGPPRSDVPEGLAFQRVCHGLEEFLQYVVDHCDPYWLSYRTRLGYTTALEFELFPHLPAVARLIPGAYWVEQKSEAIDPSLPFLWFDDNVELEDEEWLVRNSVQDNLVRVDDERADNPVLMLECVRNRLATLG